MCHLYVKIRLFFSSEQKVMACRKELVEYDSQQQEAVAAASRVSPVTSPRDITESPLKARKVPSCAKPQSRDR